MRVTGCRFPAGHMAVVDNTDRKEVQLRLWHFQNLLFLSFKKRVEIICADVEIRFQNAHSLCSE